MAIVSGTADIIYQGSPRSPVLIALAHGAGAGMNSPFMEQLSSGLAERGHGDLVRGRCTGSQQENAGNEAENPEEMHGYAP